MNETTNGDMELLLKEENIQTLTNIFTPLIQAAVNAAMPPGIMELTSDLRQARDDLAAARQEIEQVKASFVVAEDARKLAENIDQVKATTTAHEQEIATLRATYDTRFELVDKQTTAIRRDIDQGVKSVARSARTMNRTVAKWLKESAKKEQDAAEHEKKRQAEIDQKMQEMKDAHEEDIKRVEERQRVESLVVRDIDGRVQRSIDQVNIAMYGDEKKKTPGLVEDMKTVKKDVAPIAFLFGTKIGWMVLSFIYVTGVIILSEILKNPSLIKTFFPAA